jgi:hypothetical protein
MFKAVVIPQETNEVCGGKGGMQRQKLSSIYLTFYKIHKPHAMGTECAGVPRATEGAAQGRASSLSLLASQQAHLCASGLAREVKNSHCKEKLQQRRGGHRAQDCLASREETTRWKTCRPETHLKGVPRADQRGLSMSR